MGMIYFVMRRIENGKIAEHRLEPISSFDEGITKIDALIQKNPRVIYPSVGVKHQKEELQGTGNGWEFHGVISEPRTADVCLKEYHSFDDASRALIRQELIDKDNFATTPEQNDIAGFYVKHYVGSIQEFEYNNARMGKPVRITKPERDILRQNITQLWQSR